MASSPLGQLDSGQLRNANNGVISGVVNGVWNRGSGFGSSLQGWQQNDGLVTCLTATGFDNSCAANEEVADMLMNWVYDKASSIFINDPSNTDLAGSSRRNFLDTRMVGSAGWITTLVTTAMPN